jgi:hypothetical protein
MNGEIMKKRNVIYTPALQLFASSKAEMGPSEVEGISPQLQRNNRLMMLWPDPLLLVGRASIKSGQRIRFATSAASSLLSTIHQ